MDRYPHFHLWLVPWPADATTRGPRYLVDAVVHVEPDEAATRATAERLRGALAQEPDAVMTAPVSGPLARRLGTGDAVVVGLCAMVGAGVFSVFAPAADAAGAGLLIGLAHRRGGGDLQRGRLGPARDGLPDVGRHLRLRP